MAKPLAFAGRDWNRVGSGAHRWLYMTFVERKIAAWIQDRVGPNRVGPLGLFQAIADGIKIFLKEQIIPGHVNKACTSSLRRSV